MKISGRRNLGLVLSLSFFTVFFVSAYLGVNSRAQDKSLLPGRTGYVNDFAGVVEERTKQRLETTLEIVKQRTGIEFDIATVQTTGSQDMFDFSRHLASDWNIGARYSKKSLLLVVSVSEKTVFTQFSKSVQGDLPEGILGEIGQRVRGQINEGRFSAGLSDGVNHFVSRLSKKIGFSLQDIEQTQIAAADSNPSAAKPSPGARAGEEAATVTTPPAKPADELPTVTTPPAKPAEELAVATSPAKPTDERARVTTPPVKVAKGRSGPSASAKPLATSKEANTTVDDEDEAEEVELTLTLPLAERPAKLKEFLEAYPKSKARPRAFEMLISTYAGLGDQRLKEGDTQGGTEQLMLAISEAPANTTDQLFSGVISQIPSNLYLRDQRAAALKAAQMIEAKFGGDPRRLLALAGFYLGIEDGEEASRVAALAVRLAPDQADAHRALGLGLHISLRLDEAAAEYRRALELDPGSKMGTRRSLADLERAAGRAEAALVLYRAQLEAEPTDKAARAGMVLSLLDLGRAEEANKELATALESEPRNLALLAGVSYWFVAHNDSERALDLARKAVALEPRYTWSQIALARSLLGQKKPLEAERAIRFAGQYGKFPTLDYELANVLASVGLYDEAAEILQRSFVLKEGQLETRLAGRVPARAASFTELLAPERRASIFQFTAADNAGDAAMLKALMALDAATTQVSERDKLDEVRVAAAAAKKFADGSDDMRAYRQLFAANRLVRRSLALQTAYELTEAARSSVEAALGVPGVTVAVQAEELRYVRARAIGQGSTPEIPEAPRNVLSNILRGRIEDLAGLALFNQDKTTEAVEHLKRAANILPEGTPSWRNALWHLGAALDQAGDKQQALSYYIRSFNSGEAEPLRRVVIEDLYRKINGSLEGLDERIGAKVVATNLPAAVRVENPAASEPATASSSPPAQTGASPAPTPAASPDITASAPVPAEPLISPSPSPSPTPEAPISSPEPTPEPSSPSDPLQPPSETRARLVVRVKIMGKVKDGNENGLANVVVVLISPRGTVLASTTDSEGNYSFTVAPSQQSYRVIPSKSGYAFLPVDRVLAGFGEDQKTVDFVGKAREP